MNLLKNKTALITGGSDGIGFATATAFAEQGANLILIGRDREKLSRSEKLLKQYDITVHVIAADIKANFSQYP